MTSLELIARLGDALVTPSGYVSHISLVALFELRIMGVCSIFSCSNNSRQKGICLHRFPNDPNVSKVWINVCKRKDFINVKDARICSVHFKTEDYERNFQHELLPQLYKRNCHRLKKTAVPSLNLPLKDVTPGMF